MHIVYLSIGSNLGKREANCLKAIELLSRKVGTIKRRSSMYETEPEGLKEQPQFINMAVELKTDLSPQRLLKTLKEIEKEMGRKMTIRGGPRIIDLDILLYDDLILREPELEIPHPLIHKREFVLKPLSEITPELREPLLGKTIMELLEEL